MRIGEVKWRYFANAWRASVRCLSRQGKCHSLEPRSRTFLSIKNGKVRSAWSVKHLVPFGDLKGDAKSCLRLEHVLSS